MKSSQIFFKTMKFTWLKLALGLATVAISAIILALFVGISLLFHIEGAMNIFILIWIGISCAAYYFINVYFGYMVKAAHVAIISTAVVTGQIPDNQFEVGKQMVKSRFATSNVYFVIDRLVGGAVSQLQRGLQHIDNLFKNIPVVSAIISFLQLFVSIALNYVDECCLGYTFINPNMNAFKAAADGVVIYFQNWKKLLKSAAMTALLVILLTIVAWVVPFLLLLGLFTLLHWNIWIGVILAFFVALSVKSAFIDSYIMIKMMVSYMEVAPTTQITFDLYGKLCKLSRKFRSLFEKGNDGAPIPEMAFAGAAASQPQYQAPYQQPMQQAQYQQQPMQQTQYQQQPVQQAPNQQNF